MILSYSLISAYVYNSLNQSRSISLRFFWCLRSEIQDALVAQEISLKTTKALKHRETWSHLTPSAVQHQRIVNSPRVQTLTHTDIYIYLLYILCVCVIIRINESIEIQKLEIIKHAQVTFA